MHTQPSRDVRPWDIAVIGGGLAGLVSAARAASAGQSVILLERGKHLGGRGATTVQDGVSFNLGPHALYCRGDLFRICRDLGVPYSGRIPNGGRSQLVLGRRRFDLPAGTRSLLASRLFTLREKWKLARLFPRIAALDPRTLEGRTASEWVTSFVGTGNLSRLLHTLIRLGTFINDPEELSARTVVEQLQVGLGGVWYVDGGWQTLVTGLADRARERGAEIRVSSPVHRLAPHEEGFEIDAGGGSAILARSVIVALPPDAAVEILDLPERHPLRSFVQSVRPARAACLDVALSRLPRPEERFSLGLDVPMYLSVHSAAAKLGPEGVAVVQVMKYLGPDRPQSHETVERELEQFLDDTQPGWREFVVSRRFLPGMIPMSAIPTVGMGGTTGRPTAAIESLPGAFLAGDWVGPKGLLADASAASGEQAARLALEFASRSRAHAAEGQPA